VDLLVRYGVTRLVGYSIYKMLLLYLPLTISVLVIALRRSISATLPTQQSGRKVHVEYICVCRVNQPFCDIHQKRKVNLKSTSVFRVNQIYRDQYQNLILDTFTHTYILKNFEISYRSTKQMCY